MQVVKAATKASQELGGGDGTESCGVRAMLSQLDKRADVAEMLFLQQGRVRDAITMYQDVQRWEDAIRVAEQHHAEDVEAMKAQYYKWLLETGQEEKAGAVKVRGPAQADWLTESLTRIARKLTLIFVQ